MNNILGDSSNQISSNPPPAPVHPPSKTKVSPVSREVSETGISALEMTQSANHSKFIRKTFHLKDQIKEYAQLFKRSLKLTAHSEIIPLQHFNLKAENASDVYITDKVVFKPGAEAALKAKLSYGLMRIIGLENAVLPSRDAVATVISRDDKNEDGSDKKYAVVEFGPSKCCLCLSKGVDKLEGIDIVSLQQNDQTIYKIQGVNYTLSIVNNAYKLKEVSNKLDDLIAADESFKAVKNQDGETYLAAEHHMLELESVDNNQTVNIQGKMYKIHLKENDESIIELEPENPNDAPLIYQKMFHLDKTKLQSQSELWINENAYFPFDFEDINERKLRSEESEDVSVENSEEENNKVEYSEEEDNEVEYSEEEYFEEKPIFSSFEGKDYIVTKEGNNYYYEGVKNESLLDQSYALVSLSDGCKKLIPKKLLKKAVENSEILVKKGNVYFVKRNDQDYEATIGKDSIKVVGKNVKGMIQSKISNLFTGQKTNKDKALDLRSINSDKEIFYNRISMELFIEAFFATLLLRPQDGKILILDESNVLFSALPNAKGVSDPNDDSCKLMPILIDLDEALPNNNVKLTVKKLFGEGTKEVNPVRFGMMGFSLARRNLDSKEKEQVLSLIEETVSKKTELDDYFKSFTSKDKGFILKENVVAFFEVVASLEAFLNNHQNHSVEWCLQDLCFAVLPSYAEEWQTLGSRFTPEEKANYIGFNSMEEMKNIKI